MKRIKWNTKLLTLILVFALVTPRVIPITQLGTVVEASSKIKIKMKTVSIEKGRFVKLRVIGTSKKVTWKSKNKKIATVSSDGKVTGEKVGKVKITATVNKKTYSCTVTVKDKKETTKITAPTTTPTAAPTAAAPTAAPTTPTVAPTNAQASAQYYLTLAKIYDEKAEEQERSVEFARQNITDAIELGYSVGGAQALYNSAYNLLQTYKQLAAKYRAMAQNAQ